MRTSRENPKSSRKYYPLLLDLASRRVVVIGGGRVAERKVRGLAASISPGRAEVRVVSPTITPGLRRLAATGLIRHIHRRWRLADLRGAWLVYAATDDRVVNHEIAVRARAGGCLVNAVNTPEEGNVLVPAVMRRGDLVIAISTGGVSPALARTLRRELTRQFGAEYQAFLALLGQARRLLGEKVRSEARRRLLLRRLVESNVLALLRRGEMTRAVRLARQVTGLRTL